jgi:hypothetical protein
MSDNEKTGQAPNSGADFSAFELATNPDGQPKPKQDQPTTQDVDKTADETPVHATDSQADTQDTSDEDVKDPRIQRANREAARYRVERNAARQELEDMQNKLKTLENQISETAQSQVDELIEKARERELAAIQRERQAEMEILKVKHNLSEDDMEVLGKIDDTETLQAVAERMAKPATQVRPAVGNSGESAAISSAVGMISMGLVKKSMRRARRSEI